MNLPQWITAISLALTFLVIIYWAIAFLWITLASLDKPDPWWLRPVEWIADRFNK